MNTDRVIVEACVGFFNNINIFYQEYDKEMSKIRMQFYNRLESRIKANTRIHQMHLMNTIEMLYLNELADLKDVKRNRKRRLWMKERSPLWWHSIMKTSDNDVWTEVFRMDRETFFYLKDSLYDELKQKPNAVREGIPPATKIAAALYKLASNEPYFRVGQKFGIHGISVQKALYQFCEACTKVLQGEHIAMPQDEEISDVMQKFQEKISLPQVLGAMEGTAISISPKAVGFLKHLKANGSTDIVLNAVIDASGLFRDIIFCQDAIDFLDYSYYIKQMMSSMPSKQIDDVNVSAYLISCGTEAVQSWVMTPYKRVASPEEESFNDYLSQSSSIAEQSFKRLKDRWRILQEPLIIAVNFIPKVITTCCILHNILEGQGFEYEASMRDEIKSDDSDILYNGVDLGEESSLTGVKIRNFLKSYITKELDEVYT